MKIVQGYQAWRYRRVHDPRPFTLPPSECYPCSYDDMVEGLDGLQQQYGEMYAEHRSETAMFGDSWPGAQPQLRAMRQTITRLEKQVKGHHEHKPYIPPVFESIADNDADLPF